jgi:hypothetical protein
VFYKAEVIQVVNRFIDVFEDNARLASRFTRDTQEYIHQGTEKEGQSNDTFNLKIEAPVMLIPEGQRLWIADLGMFDITKAGVEQNTNKEVVLEGKSAKVYFIDLNLELSNLNQIIHDPELIQDFLPKMNLVVTDLEFSITLFKTEIQAVEEGAPKKLVNSLNFTIDPFRINLFDSALQSLLVLFIKIVEDSKREKAFIDKIMKKGDTISTSKEIEFDIGYEVWQESTVVLEGKNLYAVSEDYKLLTGQDLSSVTKIGLEQASDQLWYLHLSFKHKKIAFRSEDKNCLTDLRFKIQSMISVLEQGSDESAEGDSLVKQFNSDFIISLQFTEVVLSVSNYFKDANSFEFSVTGVSFSSQMIDGIEQGSFQFIDCIVLDNSDKFRILNFESGLTEAKPGLIYKYKYVEGQLDSEIQLCTVTLAYKVEYVQSLMKLTELIMGYLIEGKKNRIEKAPKRKQSTDLFNLDDPIIRRSTAKHNILVSCSNAVVDLYFKKDIRSVAVSAKKMTLRMISQGLNSTLTGEIHNVSLVDFNKYPFKKGQPELETPLELVYLKENGKVTFTFVTTEVDPLKALVETSSEFHISGAVLNWIQQPMLRYFDFVIFQVLEIFYPTLLSFSKYYSKEDIIRGALFDLNKSSFLKQSYNLTDSIVNLPSTIDMTKTLRLKVPHIAVTNDRLLLKKTANRDQVSFFHLEELESDIWNINIHQVELAVAAFPSSEVIHTLEPFDFSVKVHYLTKLFELSFLYDIEDDLLKFDRKSLAILADSEHRGYLPKRKEEKPLAELRSYSRHFINLPKREKLLVDGRYHVEIAIEKARTLLTNQVVNLMNEIIGNNINFDDGMDKILKNTYETTDKVMFPDIRVCRSTARSESKTLRLWYQTARIQRWTCSLFL